MASSGSDVVHIICPIEDITTNKKIKERKFKEITAAICALLNSKGGSVVLHIDSQGSSGKRLPSQTQVSTVIRILEQSLISIIGVQLTGSNIHFQEENESIVILVTKANSLITTNYNLHFPSKTQVLQVPASEKNNYIIERKVISQAVVPGSHLVNFRKDENCDLLEGKINQFKCLKSDASNRTTLADRITGNGNKFSCYVSAFANYNGGHIYYGINDDGVVEGQVIPSEKDKNEITKKVEKAINKMIWPELIGQPKRGEHWEIFFESVVDEKSKLPVPSTFVIVIYIAPCLGGVFTEEPECYEMVEGIVKKMSFETWKKRILQLGWLRSKQELPHSVGRIQWTSIENRNTFTFVDKELMNLVANGKWIAIFKKGESLLKKHAQLPDIKLYVLSKYIIARYRRGHFIEAQVLLLEYTDILQQAQDRMIFEVLQLYLYAALKRASGDLVGLKKFLFAALSKADLIEPGLVPAIIYIFAATLPDLIKSEDPTMNSPEQLSIKTLQHWDCVTCSCNDNVLPDMKHKSYLTLATFYLCFNISGQRIKGNEDVRLNEAKNCIMTVHESTCEGHPLSKYSEVELNLVQSMYNYRYSQGAEDQRARYLGDAFNYAEKAESLARDYQFTEQVEWSKTLKALCTEELLRARLLSGVAIR